MRWSALVFATLAAVPSWALTPFSTDVSDLWWDPAESGWGVNLAQQNDVVFATMFVYGSDGRPRWFSASAMNGVGATPANGVAFFGRLYESTGPTQPGAFRAAEVARRDVGSVRFETRNENSADLTYTVDGVTVRKRVQRLTMRAANASGEYTGYKAALERCAQGATPRNTPAIFRILQDARSFTLIETINGRTCNYTGAPEQRGRILHVAGTFMCGGFEYGTFELSNATVGYRGFMGRLAVTPESGSSYCPTEARIGGLSGEGTAAGRASVDASDLWWNPDESGWGINVQLQDDVGFATIFTYGADRQPRWYSASDMRIGFTRPGGLPSMAGKLFESTGPGFTTAFNSAAVTRREVGEISLDATERPDEATLVFTVDGARYAKKLRRLTMKENDSSGSYSGLYAGGRTCPGSGTFTFVEPITFRVTQGNGTFSLTDTTANQACTYSAGYEQHGRMLWSQGSYRCTGFLPEDGTYTISQLEVGQEGLMAQITRTASSTSSGNRSCTMAGRIAGVRPF